MTAIQLPLLNSTMSLLIHYVIYDSFCIYPCNCYVQFQEKIKFICIWFWLHNLVCSYYYINSNIVCLVFWTLPLLPVSDDYCNRKPEEGVVFVAMEKGNDVIIEDEVSVKQADGGYKHRLMHTICVCSTMFALVCICIKVYI